MGMIETKIRILYMKKHPMNLQVGSCELSYLKDKEKNVFLKKAS